MSPRLRSSRGKVMYSLVLVLAAAACVVNAAMLLLGFARPSYTRRIQPRTAQRSFQWGQGQQKSSWNPFAGEQDKFRNPFATSPNQNPFAYPQPNIYQSLFISEDDTKEWIRNAIPRPNTEEIRENAGKAAEAISEKLKEVPPALGEAIGQSVDRVQTSIGSAIPFLPPPAQEPTTALWAEVGLAFSTMMGIGASFSRRPITGTLTGVVAALGAYSFFALVSETPGVAVLALVLSMAGVVILALKDSTEDDATSALDSPGASVMRGVLAVIATFAFFGFSFKYPLFACLSLSLLAGAVAFSELRRPVSKRMWFGTS